MRILHLSDTHLGARWAVHGAPEGWCRGDDHAAVLEQALAPAVRGQVDAVIHTGDLFDRASPSDDVLRGARALLGAAARRVPVVIVPGSRDGALGALLRELPGVRVCDRPQRIVLGDVSVGCVPYARSAAQWAADASWATAPGPGERCVDLLAVHQPFEGAKVEGSELRVGFRRDTVGIEHLPPGVGEVLGGHVHTRQIVRVGPVRVVYPGSPERTALSEEGQTKGYAIWTRSGEGWSVALEDLPARPLVVVRGVVDLDRVVPQAIVCAPEHLRGAVSARGGWVLTAGEQLGLFPSVSSGGQRSSAVGRGRWPPGNTYRRSG